MATLFLEKMTNPLILTLQEEIIKIPMTFNQVILYFLIIMIICLVFIIVKIKKDRRKNNKS